MALPGGYAPASIPYWVNTAPKICMLALSEKELCGRIYGLPVIGLPLAKL
jgi:hypothetical protein